MLAEEIHAIVLRAQIDIEAPRNSFNLQRPSTASPEDTQPGAETPLALPWTHASAVVPQFTGSTVVYLPALCTFDLNVTANNYIYSLLDDGVPLYFQFSGIVFYRERKEALRMAPIPWENQARFWLSKKVWQELMDNHYPHSAWFCLRRDVFDQLHEYQARYAIVTAEQAVEQLLAAVEHLRDAAS